jgi:hypothetical protein
MDPRTLLGGRAYYEAVAPAKEAAATDRYEDICTAQTDKGKRCKHVVSRLEPAASMRVCQMHCNPNTIFYAVAHPKRSGPSAVAPKTFRLFFQATIALDGKTYAAATSQVLSNVKPAVKQALTSVGVPCDTVLEAVDVQNEAVAGCMTGPLNVYGGKVDKDGNVEPFQPEKYTILEVTMPNPNPLTYTSSTDFFAGAEGSAITAALQSLNLGPGFQDWTVNGSAASYVFTVLPDLDGGGPCATKESRSKRV